MEPCKCNGMNKACMICDGSGFVTNSKVTIIKRPTNQKAVEKENEELNSYVKGSDEKMYVSNHKSKAKRRKPKQKVVTIASLDNSGLMNFIGPELSA